MLCFYVMFLELKLFTIIPDHMIVTMLLCWITIPTTPCKLGLIPNAGKKIDFYIVNLP